MAAIIILLVVNYTLSAYFMYEYFHLAKSKNGIYPGEKTTILEVVYVLTPFLNTLSCMYGWMFHYPLKNGRKHKRKTTKK